MQIIMIGIVLIEYDAKDRGGDSAEKREQQKRRAAV